MSEAIRETRVEDKPKEEKETRVEGQPSTNDRTRTAKDARRSQDEQNA
jgi:hypothetical protein